MTRAFHVNEVVMGKKGKSTLLSLRLDREVLMDIGTLMQNIAKLSNRPDKNDFAEFMVDIVKREFMRLKIA
jgi:hypothetical protein